MASRNDAERGGISAAHGSTGPFLLRPSHKQMIPDSAAEGIVGIDERGVATFVNASAARMLGYLTVDLVARHCPRAPGDRLIATRKAEPADRSR